MPLSTIHFSKNNQAPSRSTRHFCYNYARRSPAVSFRAIGLVETSGIEPPTSGLQSRRSPN